ncbi:4-formylbenzenesulfonate dehydrogenase TsaC1/TsaC2 [Mycobacterium marinum]|uniref:4-formylbenzenesulfonate dehydrogenase TsaC1/TsaC2 n=1 Tax=Mycobacterium marinum TaxID=1781 RepID=A0A2Z5YEX8_MYCMR|nr:SDR family oxidoreductase [Mycobacterium marinum]AXN44533.1 4-formylbenzenesulfonate dehydrogenase TsaC1/TsaC2 [Mycobacterium marinum]AXN49895.1 4-formylbenzenesulfonate dehydrogenase TsaC1/TsaC2 [Mycobacterium marinum]RFZ04708.1 4-formylbenzenesulfonate dehydrogenase TsaC1/TsaC2 [Mycobacterium marinum]RFZ12549.1 4-formylbenzenesulfonate dehydrogenase TsaC1/TsaC2 [Mycobacterium marinum]RFZ19704.1 4-formylbenzenesulfonate dehydrogenase TsaC1/TsaC2 [Mycobacterium marinum]
MEEATPARQLLTDRVAVVTGGGSGIGAATSRLFAQHGAQVVIADIDAELAHRTVDEIGGAAWAVGTDVRDADQVSTLAQRVLDRYGRVDILVNNVGHWLRHPGNFVDTDPQLWDELYRVNLHHVLLATHAFLPAMIEQHGGAIVNVSSVEGLRGYPEDPVYAAFKAAVIHFTRSLAVQVGNHGVRINAIAPDVTESLQVPYSQWLSDAEQTQWPGWVPVGRMGVPEDQARVILFLACELSAFVTGHTIPTDGGTAAAGGWFRSSRRPDREWTNRPIAP